MCIEIIETSSFLPEDTLDNEALSQMVDTTDQWIVERTGIRNRHISRKHTTEEMAESACKELIRKSGVSKDKVNLLIFASVTSDSLVPSSAYTVAGKLGLNNAFAFDINAACSGFIYGLDTAKALMREKNLEYAIVVGSERLSKYVDWSDRATCVLFGDGAGCVLLKNTMATSDKSSLMTGKVEILETETGGEYDKNKYLSIMSADSIDDENAVPFIRMNGRQVYKFATEIGVDVINKMLDKRSLKSDDVFMVVPHQANRRIVSTLAEKSGIPMEKWFINLDRLGNTSAASIPIAMDEAFSKTDMKKHKGKYIISVSFGGGLTYGGILMKIC